MSGRDRPSATVCGRPWVTSAKLRAPHASALNLSVFNVAYRSRNSRRLRRNGDRPESRSYTIGRTRIRAWPPRGIRAREGMLARSRQNPVGTPEWHSKQGRGHKALALKLVTASEGSAFGKLWPASLVPAKVPRLITFLVERRSPTLRRVMPSNGRALATDGLQCPRTDSAPRLDRVNRHKTRFPSRYAAPPSRADDGTC
jgi:hypothetical protein